MEHSSLQAPASPLLSDLLPRIYTPHLRCEPLAHYHGTVSDGVLQTAVVPVQALIDSLEAVDAVTAGNAHSLELLYDIVLGAVGVTVLVTLMFLVLAGGGVPLL
jgi:hypothetical protein